MSVAGDLFLLPPAGGMTGDPSSLRLVDRFLGNESNLNKVRSLTDHEISIQEYESLIDFLLVELMTEFRDACFEFYRGPGKSFGELHSYQKRSEVDEQLRNTLEFLISGDWTSWQDFKGRYGSTNGG